MFRNVQLGLALSPADATTRTALALVAGPILRTGPQQPGLCQRLYCITPSTVCQVVPGIHRYVSLFRACLHCTTVATFCQGVCVVRAGLPPVHVPCQAFARPCVAVGPCPGRGSCRCPPFFPWDACIIARFLRPCQYVFKIFLFSFRPVPMGFPKHGIFRLWTFVS